jgi:hypothetical protein
VTEIRFDVDLDHLPERGPAGADRSPPVRRVVRIRRGGPTNRDRLRLPSDPADGFVTPVDVDVIKVEAPVRFVTR